VTRLLDPFLSGTPTLTILGMTYRTTAAYPNLADADQAVAALRGDLRMAAARDGAVPDWSTLRVTGPNQVVGVRGVFWYEWTATVDSQDVPAHYL
jgi:hypothetical protein